MSEGNRQKNRVKLKRKSERDGIKDKEQKER